MTAWTLVAACVLSLALTPPIRAAAVRLHIVDRPDPRKIHTLPTALLGGLAVFAATALPVLFVFGISRESLALLLGGALFFAIGLADDLRNVGAGKLLAEFAVALLIVSVTGEFMHLPWPGAGAVLTILWIVGIVNAFNCLDCADGVATGAGLVAGSVFLVLAVLTHQRFEMVFAATLVGATLGFLPYNLPPARIFLGNAGSLTLGYLVAILAVLVAPGMLSAPALAAKPVILAIPIYDIIRVHVLRFLQGERTVRGLLTSTGKDHLPHRLMDRGLSPRTVVLVIGVASAATGAAGIALAMVHFVPGAVLIAMTALIAIAILEREWVVPAVRESSPLVSPSGWHKPEGP